MICPDCNIDHAEVPINGENAIFGFHCPLRSSDPTHLLTCRINGQRSYPGIKRSLTVIIEPLFDDNYQCWRGEVEQYSLCCHQMKYQRLFCRALRIQAGNIGQSIPDKLMFDPDYHAGEVNGRGVEFNGKPIDECPYCNADVRIIRLVRE